MSLLDELVDSDFVKISRSPDFDHFRSIEGLGEASSIPLDCRGFAASFASLRLKACTIYLQRTFPRILQIQYSTAGAIVGLMMDDAASLILNGVEARAPAFLLVKGTAKCEIVEQQANLVALVNFDSVDDRGWPGEPDRAQVIATEPAKFEALRTTLRDVLKLASHSPDTLVQPDVIESIEESILQAVDLVMAAASPASEAKRLSLSHYLALVRKFDEFVAVNAGKTLYSADVARQLGVSVRTLHNAVVAIRGMSMHRYMRLRRLWSVRQQLLRGASLQSIKAVALVNGFWHMGEFTSLYRELFGETPQQTLSAARKPPGEPS
ncbi:helix-turn-helix domain-containing protein [Bradyrhizobium sp. AUGA SZCCT0283]|uniref:helix-turn-helix domain-containing protein n=1 Tax=Bradyrhizobium sp. AUGA SZCCT0283 TaxID=2807671 RepID=UPI001BA6FD4F|nr:helix-turn-helix domain-containing protein [Bradyrhizobium sp. AUGA SZCCT0283]MBR1274533.1 helix-turn-helix domain-containing protein [Bradyrhizobium sp. AUGA SZCCT0283]